MRILDFMYIVLAVTAQSISLLFSKIAALNAEGISRYTTIWYLGSLIALGFQAIVWQQALKRVPLSKAYPMMSLVFIVILFLSRIIFKENVNYLQIVGTFFIVIGVIKLNSEYKK